MSLLILAGVIYKIHGCVSDPASLVLTQTDYVDYRGRNAYLSAKLMTIFLEHPIIFIGYSITDSNIRMIFNDIAICLNESQFATLSERLIFVQRAKDGRAEGISTVRDNFGPRVIESKRVVLSDFSKLYKAIAGMRSSYPPKILRKLKKDLYDLVLSTSPKERIRVIDIDDSTEVEKVEYVMGVGISRQLAGQGYGGIEVIDLIKDLIHEETGLDAKQVLQIVLPKLCKQNSNNLPVFKYISQAGDEGLAEEVVKYITEVREQGVGYWITKSMVKARVGKSTPATLEEVCKSNDLTTAKGAQQMLQELAFVPEGKIDLESFRALLVDVWRDYDPIRNKSEQTLTTNFRKAVRIYDWLKYGHKKTPEAPKREEAE